MGELGKKQELTSRQKEILSLLRKGLTNSEICFALNISANTVKVHLANIYRILEVTNRTEAVSTDMASDPQDEDKDEITLAICHNDDFQNAPLAHTLYLGVVQALQGCGVFQIKVCGPNDDDRQCDYRIKLSTTQGENQALFLSLHKKDSEALLWSNLQKIQGNEDINLLTEQTALQLFRHIILAAANTYEACPNSVPQWWYASCYTILKIEIRSKSDFEQGEKILQALLQGGKHTDFVAGALTATYYAAITENWVNGEEYIKKIGEIVSDAMRKNPSSVYALYSIALYNMLLGNNREAINYFELIMHSSSPIHAICRRMLSQAYSLTDQGEKAQLQLDEYNRVIPESMYQPFQILASAFIHFMHGEYEECQKMSEQLLMFHPEIPYARLLTIACNYRAQNFDEYRKQSRMLFEYNPNFSSEDLHRFFDCFAPAQRGLIAEYLSDLFE